MEYQIAGIVISIIISSLVVILTISIGLLTFFVAFRWEQMKEAAAAEADLHDKHDALVCTGEEIYQHMQAFYLDVFKPKLIDSILWLMLAIPEQPFVQSYIRKIRRLKHLLRSETLTKVLLVVKPFNWVYFRGERKAVERLYRVFPPQKNYHFKEQIEEYLRRDIEDAANIAFFAQWLIVWAITQFLTSSSRNLPFRYIFLPFSSLKSGVPFSMSA